jgi:putative SOS response-associated peptidase YedK
VCGRFALSAMLTDIAEEFSTHNADSDAPRSLPIDWNIKPTQDIFIIKSDSVRKIDVVSWGLIAPWSKTGEEALRSQSQAINARFESVHEKPTFRRAFTRSRCLIPASGYYEWATELGRYKTKQPVFISSEDKNLLAFSGIYESWISPEGATRKSAAIITRPAVGELAKVHDRMPLFLPKESWDEWLDPENRDVEYLRSLMEVKNPDEGLRFWPVRSLVNSIKNNGPELIEPIELGEPETLF